MKSEPYGSTMNPDGLEDKVSFRRSTVAEGWRRRTRSRRLETSECFKPRAPMTD